MDFNQSVESGLQLLARLSSRPSLEHLDDIVFPHGLNPGNVVQISGDTSVGKSMLLLKFIAKCILPEKYKDVQINGIGSGAILIDTDHNIPILKLVTVMESYLTKLGGGPKLLENEEIKVLIEDALKNLVILKTYSSDQLMLSIQSLRKILASNNKLSLLVIDSITSYYWSDCMKVKNYRKMDLYLKVMIEKVKKCIQEYNIVSIFVKQDYFQSKISNGKLTSTGLINYFIDLKKPENSNLELFNAMVDSSEGKYSYHYSISQEGFCWIV